MTRFHYTADLQDTVTKALGDDWIFNDGDANNPFWFDRNSEALSVVINTDDGYDLHLVGEEPDNEQELVVLAHWRVPTTRTYLEGICRRMRSVEDRLHDAGLKAVGQ